MQTLTTIAHLIENAILPLRSSKRNRYQSHGVTFVYFRTSVFILFLQYHEDQFGSGNLSGTLWYSALKKQCKMNHKQRTAFTNRSRKSLGALSTCYRKSSEWFQRLPNFETGVILSSLRYSLSRLFAHALLNCAFRMRPGSFLET